MAKLSSVSAENRPSRVPAPWRVPDARCHQPRDPRRDSEQPEPRSRRPAVVRWLRPLAFALAVLLVEGARVGAAFGEGGEIPPDEEEDVRSILCPECQFEAPLPPDEGLPVSAERDRARPLVVKIHADWCLLCTFLEVVWDDLRRDPGADARLVVLDVSDRASLVGARAEAERLGILPFFNRHRGRTGTIGILDGDDRALVEAFYGSGRVEDYRRAIEKARKRKR